MAEAYDEAFNYDWLTRRWSKIVNNRELQYRDHIFPLSVIGAGGWDLPNWVQGYEQYWKDRVRESQEAGNTQGREDAERHAENARVFGEHLRGITEQYQISYTNWTRNSRSTRSATSSRKSTARASGSMRSTSSTPCSNRRGFNSSICGAKPSRV